MRRIGPLAIHTFSEAGEEIAYGDPSVTDAQRAAAGRETLAERSRALLEANRRRAAVQHAASTLPDDQELVRVWQPRDPEALRVRLGNTPLAAWAEDDILHVLWRGQADEVHLAAGIQPRLWPVQGAMDLWEASVRIRRLAEAVITIAVLPRRADDDQGSQISDKLVWRGPQASALLPTAASLAGAITEQVLDSAALGAPRAVTVYHPPGRPAPLLGCVLADGGAARSFAGTLEPAILTGAVPPVLLVGVHNAVDPATPGPDLRAREYVPGRDQRRFDAHLGFVVDQVIPWATEQLGAAATPWTAAGFSNGGDGRSRLRSADPTSSPGWPPSASGSSPTRSASRLARPGCATIWPPGPWSRASGARPTNGLSTCSAPGWAAAIASGSAATITCGGHSSSRPPWSGCSPSHEPAPGPSHS